MANWLYMSQSTWAPQLCTHHMSPEAPTPKLVRATVWPGQT